MKGGEITHRVARKSEDQCESVYDTGRPIDEENHGRRAEFAAPYQVPFVVQGQEMFIEDECCESQRQAASDDHY